MGEEIMTYRLHGISFGPKEHNYIIYMENVELDIIVFYVSLT